VCDLGLLLQVSSLGVEESDDESDDEPDITCMHEKPFERTAVCRTVAALSQKLSNCFKM